MKKKQNREDVAAPVKETATVSKTTTEVAAIELKGFEYNNKFYGLSDRTPKTLKVLEDVYTQEELLKNKNAMEFLIVGRSSFIKLLN